jgi:hypothetical protein
MPRGRLSPAPRAVRTSRGLPLVEADVRDHVEVPKEPGNAARGPAERASDPGNVHVEIRVDHRGAALVEEVRLVDATGDGQLLLREGDRADAEIVKLQTKPSLRRSISPRLVSAVSARSLAWPSHVTVKLSPWLLQLPLNVRPTSTTAESVPVVPLAVAVLHRHKEPS